MPFTNTFNKKLKEQADAVAWTMVETFDRRNGPSQYMIHVLEADGCKVIINAVVADKTVYPNL